MHVKYTDERLDMIEELRRRIKEVAAFRKFSRDDEDRAELTGYSQGLKEALDMVLHSRLGEV